MHRFELDRNGRAYPYSFELENCKAMGRDAAKAGKSSDDNPFSGINAVHSYYWAKGFKDHERAC